jgi:hypothetical protein
VRNQAFSGCFAPFSAHFGPKTGILGDFVSPYIRLLSGVSYTFKTQGQIAGLWKTRFRFFRRDLRCGGRDLVDLSEPEKMAERGSGGQLDKSSLPGLSACAEVCTSIIAETRVIIGKKSTAVLCREVHA